MINLFYEASTRTRTSFEIAGKRLSADTINISASTSSVVKGETLIDTARNLEAMNPDIIVIRHSAAGAPHLLASLVSQSIINAGDGAHEHPTQALLDMMTIKEKKGKIAGLKVAHHRRYSAQPGRPFQYLRFVQNGRPSGRGRSGHHDAARYRADGRRGLHKTRRCHQRTPMS